MGNFEGGSRIVSKGSIVAGILAPHPPHLVYAENPPQNEPKAECGWEMLRWGYERLRRDLASKEYDVIVVVSAHWQTYIGYHFLGVPHFQSLSVDPIFPNLFRFHYDLNVDVALSQQICREAERAGLVTKMMTNPDFRVDYGTIVSSHLVRPTWDKPLVAISSNRARHYYSVEVMQAMSRQLGEVTRQVIEASGKRAVLLASNSLSHRHFTVEPDIPEDMTHEHIYNHNQYLWDMKMIDLLRKGQTRQAFELMPEFTEQSVSETDAGSFTWLLSALNFPEYEAELYAYGNVIGTGNAVMAWFPENEGGANHG